MPTKIDYKKCNGCKKCYDICPFDIYTWDEEIGMPKRTYDEECWHCGICVMDCPKRAIELIYPASMW
jgi:adenylylsulfate reductase, subunit B